MRYIHEPFQPSARRCICGNAFVHWFHYVDAQQPDTAYRHFQHLLGSPLSPINMRNLLREARMASPRRRALIKLYRYARTLLAARPLVKDPIACMSADWLASTFDMAVIVVVRHPAGFANSYKRLNWSHPFSDFLAQPVLMREQLSSFSAEIDEFAGQPHDLIEQAALLWRILNSVLLRFSQKHNWLVLRHTDIARDPQSALRAVFARLGLHYSERIARRVAASTRSENPVEVSDPYNVVRNSQQAAELWKSQLAPEEIRGVRMQVEDVASAFFTDKDW